MNNLGKQLQSKLKIFKRVYHIGKVMLDHFYHFIFDSEILLISLTFVMIQCLQYQEETKEAKNNCLSLEQRYNGERVKTADVTKVSVLIKIILFG